MFAAAAPPTRRAAATCHLHGRLERRRTNGAGKASSGTPQVRAARALTHRMPLPSPLREDDPAGMAAQPRLQEGTSGAAGYECLPSGTGRPLPISGAVAMMNKDMYGFLHGRPTTPVKGPSK